MSESQLPPDRRSDEELKSSLRKGNLGERRKAFLQEILRRRDEAKAAGRSRMYLWLAAVIGVFSVGIAALNSAQVGREDPAKMQSVITAIG